MDGDQAVEFARDSQAWQGRIDGQNQAFARELLGNATAPRQLPTMLRPRNVDRLATALAVAGANLPADVLPVLVGNSNSNVPVVKSA